MAFTDRNLFLSAVVLYGVSVVYSVFLWRRGFRQDDRINYGLLACAYGMHFTAMLMRGHSLQRCPTSNLYEATLFIGWATLSAYLAIGVLRRFRFLGVFFAPILFGLGVFALMPGMDPAPQPSAYTGPGVSLHAALTLLAYGGFGLGAVAAAMYLIQERDLKLHRARIFFSLLPPIGRLERIVTWATAGGLASLTLGLLVAILTLTPPPGVRMGQDFKVLWTCLIWLLYLGMLITHGLFAWRGRRFAWGVLGLFIFLMLTYWGANWASPLHHPTSS